MPPKFSRELRSSIAYQAESPEDQPRTSPCEASCPAGHAIQRTLYLIQNDRFEEALENVRAKNPFPGTCGRACFHPCELPCNRHFYDMGISVRALERAAYDHADRDKMTSPKRGHTTGKNVAIMGSGPAGMTAAYFLALLGHDVTVFEALPVPGGMPRTCIPEYRLPKDVVDREVGEAVKMGIKVKTNTRVGKDIPFKAIVKAYDACLIATGAWKEKTLDIPGSELATSGLSLLVGVKNGKKYELGEKVVIIGGGGVAFDYAGSAKRHGAAEVHVACLEPRDKMVAPEEDVQQGEAEGVIIHNSKTFNRILSDNGRVTGVECMGVRSFEFDRSGALEVETIPGTEQVLAADTVIFAVGEMPDYGFLEGTGNFKYTEMGTLDVDPLTLAAFVDGIFAAGDAVTGPSSIAEAIGTGRRAAVSMHCYLLGEKIEEIQSIYFDSQGEIHTRPRQPGRETLQPPHVVQYDEILSPDYYEKQGRIDMRHLKPEEAVAGFDEINKGYSREEAIKEANRCFHCGHCAICGNCVELCPLDVLVMEDEGPRVAYPAECWHCGGCRINCPCGAVYYEFPLSMLI